MNSISLDDQAIDFKNLKLIKRCISDGGKIIPARLTGLTRFQQRKMSVAVRRARFLALIPYVVS